MLYNEDKIDKNDIESLNKLKSDTTTAYSKREIIDSHHTSLKDEILISYEEIFNKRIKSLDSPDKYFKANLKEIENDITYAYSRKDNGVALYFTKRKDYKI